MANVKVEETTAAPSNENPRDPAPSSNTNSQEPHTAPSQKLKRFRFKEAADLLMLKSVNDVSGHLAGWGERESKHNEALVLFLRAAPSEWFNGYVKPTAKSLGDLMRRVLAERSEQVKADEADSGNAEEYGERETILDDMLLEMKEKEEADRTAREETAAREKRLIEAGEEIRENALRRKTRKSSSSRSSPSPPAPRRSDSDEETVNILKETMDLRRQADETRLALDREKLSLERIRAEKEDDRFKETQLAVNRRLELDEKKAEVKMEERKQEMTERSK